MIMELSGGAGSDEEVGGGVFALSNQVMEDGSRRAPGWIEVPFGNHDHRDGMQVCDADAYKGMVDRFAEMKRVKGKRYKGIPIYLGHPDDGRLAGTGADKRARGWIREMAVGNTGLRLKADWTPLGRQEVEDEEVAYISPRWAVSKMSGSTRNFLPTRLVSVGLVNDPNIEGILPLINEAKVSGGHDVINDAEEEVDGDSAVKANEGDKWWAPPWVHALAGTDAATADEGDVRRALTGKVEAAREIEEALAKLRGVSTAGGGSVSNEASGEVDEALNNERARAERAEGAAALERAARAEMAVERLITTGRIAFSEKVKTLEMLSNASGDEFVEIEKKLANQAPVMAVGESWTRNLGSRRAEADAAQAGESTRQAKVIELVNERMTRTGEGYQSAWANVRRECPALFDEMKNPVQRARNAKAR